MNAAEPMLQGFAPLELLGYMTVALMLALVLIALGVRCVRSLWASRELDRALERLEEIERQLMDMVEQSKTMQAEYERATAEEKDAHAREVFSLQQTIFERNSEILDLKTDLLELSKQYGNYPYDTLPQ